MVIFPPVIVSSFSLSLMFVGDVSCCRCCVLLSHVKGSIVMIGLFYEDYHSCGGVLGFRDDQCPSMAIPCYVVFDVFPLPPLSLTSPTDI